jgi:hypothetical protein
MNNDFKEHKRKSCGLGSQGSSVIIVSGYGWDGRAIEVRCLVEANGFLLWPLYPDWLWGPSSFLSNGHQGPFPSGKAWPGCDPDHSPLSSAKVVNE